MCFTGEAGEKLCNSERAMIERGLECVLFIDNYQWIHSQLHYTRDYGRI